MHSCALTIAMLCGPKFVLVSYRTLGAGVFRWTKASRQAAGIIGTNQRRKSDRRAKRGRRGDDGPVPSSARVAARMEPSIEPGMLPLLKPGNRVVEELGQQAHAPIANRGCMRCTMH